MHAVKVAAIRTPNQRIHDSRFANLAPHFICAAVHCFTLIDGFLNSFSTFARYWQDSTLLAVLILLLPDEAAEGVPFESQPNERRQLNQIFWQQQCNCCT